MAEADDGREAFAARLRELMDAGAQDNGKPWTIPAVATALTERGYRISRQHLSGLVNKHHAPAWDLVRALADLFGTTTDSFTGRGDAGRGDAGSGAPDELPVLLNRAGDLPEPERKQVADFIRFLHQQRGSSG